MTYVALRKHNTFEGTGPDANLTVPFRQGCMLYELIPTMPEHRLQPLMARFADILEQEKSFNGLFSVA